MMEVRAEGVLQHVGRNLPRNSKVGGEKQWQTTSVLLPSKLHGDAKTFRPSWMSVNESA